MAFTYTAPDGSVLTVDVGMFGKHDVRAQLVRPGQTAPALDEKFTIQEVLAMIYPVVDTKEKAGKANA